MANANVLRPRLVVAGADQAIEYYRRVFDAEELTRFADPGGKVVHAELAVGDASFTLKDEDDADAAPTSADGYPVLLMLEVDDVDAVAARMIEGGGSVIFPIADSEYGRGGRIRDPFGHSWMLSEREPQSEQAALPRPRFCYVELPAEDVGRSAAFYEAVFGWQIRNRDSERPSFDDASAAVSGAWVLGRPAGRNPGLLPYVWVDDIDGTLEAIVEHGGEIVAAPSRDTGPGGEWIATFRDPAGNALGLYQEGSRS
jgi:PhnB protein